MLTFLSVVFSKFNLLIMASNYSITDDLSNAKHYESIGDVYDEIDYTGIEVSKHAKSTLLSAHATHSRPAVSITNYKQKQKNAVQRVIVILTLSTVDSACFNACVTDPCMDWSQFI